MARTDGVGYLRVADSSIRGGWQNPLLRPP